MLLLLYWKGTEIVDPNPGGNSKFYIEIKPTSRDESQILIFKEVTSVSGNV